MVHPLEKKLTKKDKKFLRVYYGGMIRDIGIGLLAGVVTAITLLYVRGINLMLIVSFAGLFVFIGEIILHKELIIRK